MSQFRYEKIDPQAAGEFVSLIDSTIEGLSSNNSDYLEISWALAYLAADLSLKASPACHAVLIADLIVDALKSSINDASKRRKPSDQITYWPSRSITKNLFPLKAVNQ